MRTGVATAAARSGTSQDGKRDRSEFVHGGEQPCPPRRARNVVDPESETIMKASAELLAALKDISRRLRQLSANPGEHELDPDAIVDLNLARSSVDKLVNRVERLVN